MKKKKLTSPYICFLLLLRTCWSQEDKCWISHYITDGYIYYSTATWSDDFAALKLNSLCHKNNVKDLPNPDIGIFLDRDQTVT